MHISYILYFLRACACNCGQETGILCSQNSVCVCGGGGGGTTEIRIQHKFAINKNSQSTKIRNQLLHVNKRLEPAAHESYCIC